MKDGRHYGMLELQLRAGCYALYEGGQLLAVTDDAAAADKLFFKRALELATAQGPAGRASFTPAGRAVFLTPEKDENARRLAKPAQEKPARRVFRPPTVEQVAEYCRERGNTVDAEAFTDHYESNGWMAGRVKMKDWKAAVRTWEKKEHPPQKRRGVELTNPERSSLDVDSFAAEAARWRPVWKGDGE